MARTLSIKRDYYTSIEWNGDNGVARILAQQGYTLINFQYFILVKIKKYVYYYNY